MRGWNEIIVIADNGRDVIAIVCVGIMDTGISMDTIVNRTIQIIPMKYDVMRPVIETEMLLPVERKNPPVIFNPR